MKNPFRSITLEEEISSAISRLTREKLQLSLEQIQRDADLSSLDRKITLLFWELRKLKNTPQLFDTQTDD